MAKNVRAERTDEELYHQYYHRVWRTAYYIVKDYHVAEDIVQETFMKFFESAPIFSEDRQINKWLSVAATNAAIDYLRQHKSKQNTLDNFIRTIHQYFPSIRSKVEQTIDDKLFSQLIAEAFDILPPNWSQIVLLKYYHEMSINDIAKELNLNSNTVKTRLSRSKKKLLKYLSKNKDIAERMVGSVEKNG